jgi:hypothetical protein
MEARMAMIAITTNSSISVKRLRRQDAAAELDAVRAQWGFLISTPYQGSKGDDARPQSRRHAGR